MAAPYSLDPQDRIVAAIEGGMPRKQRASANVLTWHRGEPDGRNIQIA